MSIVTKTGDSGTTALMYQRRVSKCHPRIEACGAIDELNAALGCCRAAVKVEFVRRNLRTIQKELLVLMGEIATLKEDRDRYLKDGFLTLAPSMTARLEQFLRELEREQPRPDGWAIPGGRADSAQADMARVICRRAERHVCGLHEAGELANGEVIIYLNRLSDLLWILARWLEHRAR